MVAFGGVFRIGGEDELVRNMAVSSLGQMSVYLWCLEKKSRVGEVLNL